MVKIFRINVSVIRGNPGAKQQVQWAGSLDGLEVSGSSVTQGGEVGFEGMLEAIDSSAIMAVGLVVASWQGACRRCLQPAGGDINVPVRELFELHPTDGQTYRLDGDFVDLEPMVREIVVLELPEVPLCRDNCAGLCSSCGQNLNEGSCDCPQNVGDSRWAVLEMFKSSAN